MLWAVITNLTGAGLRRSPLCFSKVCATVLDTSVNKLLWSQVLWLCLWTVFYEERMEVTMETFGRGYFIILHNNDMDGIHGIRSVIYSFSDVEMVNTGNREGEGLKLAQVAWLSKHFSAWDPVLGKPGWPAQSVKTSLGQRDKGQESPLNTVRLHFPNCTIKRRFWAHRPGTRRGVGDSDTRSW